MRRHAPLRLLLALAAGLLLGTAHAAETISGPAPDFTLKSRDGTNVKLSELRGEVVMINFWATWCGPCRQEMPLLDALYKRFQPAGFTLLGVNVEADPKAAERYLKELPVSFPVLFDTESAVSKLYNNQAMPSTVLVDRDGQLRYLHRGYVPGDEKEYEALVRELVLE